MNPEAVQTLLDELHMRIGKAKRSLERDAYTGQGMGKAPGRVRGEAGRISTEAEGVPLKAGGRWYERAACADMDPKLFFPERETAPFVYGAGKVVCGACEVRGDCLAEARSFETSRDSHGLWGGMTPVERTRTQPKAVLRGSVEQAPADMGIDWMTWDELREAIPPAYTLFIGSQLMEALHS